MRRLRIGLLIALISLSMICMWACDKGNDDANGEPNTYTIQYVDETGTHTLSVASGELFSIDSIPSKNGYEFLGLYDAEVGGTQYVHANGSSISAFTDNRNLVLYPQFKAKEYTLVLNYGEATVSGARQIKVSYGQTIAELPTNLTAENKHFAGWYTQTNKKGIQVADQYGLIPQNSLLTEEVFDLSDSRGFVHLYAGFKGEEFTVRFYYGNDPTPEEIKIEYGTYISEVITTKRVDGKATISWTKTNGGDDVFTGKVTSEMILYAYEYAPVLEFNSDGGKNVDPIIAKAGSSITLPTPTKENYTFTGWYTSGGQKYNATVMGSESVSLTARWNPMIIFNTNGGTSVENISAEVGTRVTLPATSKDGFMFAGWYTEQGQEYTATSMPQNSVKLVAKYYISSKEQIVLIEPASSIDVAIEVPTTSESCLQLDLSSILDKDINSIKVTIHYDASYKWWNVNNNKPYILMNWYTQSSASDAYKAWEYSDMFDKNDGITKYTFTHSTTLEIAKSKYFICMFVSDYNYTIMDGAFAAKVSNVWVEIEYPDMSRLY